jgi:hypothetical protein
MAVRARRSPCADSFGSPPRLVTIRGSTVGLSNMNAQLAEGPGYGLQNQFTGKHNQINTLIGIQNPLIFESQSLSRL